MVTIHEVTPRFMRRDSLALQLMLQQHRRVAMHLNGWSLAARRWNRRHRAATDSHRSGHGLLHVVSQSGHRVFEGSGDSRPGSDRDGYSPQAASSGCLSFHSGGEIHADSYHCEKRDNGSDHTRPPGRVERIAVVGEKGCHLAVLHKAE